MSSTNRSSARDAHKSDYYVTPVAPIVLFLTKLKTSGLLPARPLRVLDPCAGGDRQHAMSYPEALKVSGLDVAELVTVDRREDSRADIKADYLTWQGGAFDLIITNPPFNQALPIIKRALGMVVEDGLVAMLLRLNFFGSKERKPFFDSNMPAHAYVHSRRFKFRDTHTQDSCEYMHACWRKENPERMTRLFLI